MCAIASATPPVRSVRADSAAPTARGMPAPTIADVFGETIDGGGKLSCGEQRPVHRRPPALRLRVYLAAVADCHDDVAAFNGGLDADGAVPFDGMGCIDQQIHEYLVEFLRVAV